MTDRIIKIKDLIEYLSKYHPDTNIYLDHDGWCAGDEQNPQVIIDNRGLFSHKPPKEGEILNYFTLNN